MPPAQAEQAVETKPKPAPQYAEAPIGLSVQYIEGLDTKRPAVSAAIILDVVRESATLMVVPRTGGFLLRRDVRHASDPDLKIYPNVAARGAWDYVPEVPKEKRRVVTTEEQEAKQAKGPVNSQK